jgi:hypothetical protein
MGHVAKLHPFFVLNLTFAADSVIDRLSFDMESAATVFEDPNSVRECLRQLLRDFYSKYGDVYLTAFDKLWAETGRLSISRCVVGRASCAPKRAGQTTAGHRAQKEIPKRRLPTPWPGIPAPPKAAPLP